MAAKKRSAKRALRKKPARPTKRAPKRAGPNLSSEPPEGLRRDTPVDMPALIEAPSLLPAGAAADALAALHSSQTIEAAYQAWAELEGLRDRSLVRFAEERKRLAEQGELLLGAVRASASAASSTALVSNDAHTRLEHARVALQQQEAETIERYRSAIDEARRTALQRVQRRVVVVPPALKLMVRNVGSDRRILHAERPAPDDAVALTLALTGRIPTRYDALFDDSTDDLSLPPTVLYGAADSRPTPRRLFEFLEPLTDYWPVKASIPVWLPNALGPPTVTRWLERGPVMEAEIEDGQTFRNMLTADEAERILGRFLALRLEGRLSVELVRG